MSRTAVIAILVALTATACDSDDPTRPALPITFAFDFDDGVQGWEADFVDFPPDREQDVGFVSELRALPPPLDGNRRALYHRGENLSDDLFMYHKRRVAGLTPEATYRVRFRAGFATTIAADCLFGLGLFLKAGAVRQEPRRVIGDQGWYRLSADKGFQTDTGSEAVLLGEMRNPNPGCPEDEFGLGELGTGSEPLTVTADAQGTIWLYFGEESVFEVAHAVYYTYFEAHFEPAF